RESGIQGGGSLSEEGGNRSGFWDEEEAVIFFEICTSRRDEGYGHDDRRDNFFFSGFCGFAFLISIGDGCIALSELFSVQARHVWVLFCGFIYDVYTARCTSCPKVYHSRPSFFLSASELSKFGF
ncbi:unnamed protein product, partial [Ectocarpus sp. 8 AP-2014]